MKELIEELEIKGYGYWDVHFMLMAYGFTYHIWVSDPRYPWRKNPYYESNIKAVEEVRTQVRYWIPK